MQYTGIYTQQMRNNTKSLLLLVCFPLILLGLVYLFFVLVHGGGSESSINWEEVNGQFLVVVPYVLGIVAVWFLIAYFANTSMVRNATGARPLERRENPRVYNIVENLTMSCGMDMPKVNVIDTPELNAFASGIDKGSYTVTLTTGICNRLTDEELAGVVAHELTHIRNRDTRLLIVSIIFVGIMSTVLSLAVRLLWSTFVYGGNSERRSNGNSKGGGNEIGTLITIVIVAVLAALGYFFTLLTRFAISRKREYMADAGGAELTGNPLALASALRKISANPALADVNREDVAQLFIVHPQQLQSKFMAGFNKLFSTHPSTESRIAYLEQF